MRQSHNIYLEDNIFLRFQKIDDICFHNLKKNQPVRLIRTQRIDQRADNRSKKNYNPAACGPKTTVTERHRR